MAQAKVGGNTARARYVSVNGKWPEGPLSKPTGQEAISAVKRLYRLAMGRPTLGSSCLPADGDTLGRDTASTASTPIRAMAGVAGSLWFMALATTVTADFTPLKAHTTFVTHYLNVR